MTIHYELILLYVIGYSPKEVIRDYGYSRGAAYRFYRIYREAIQTLKKRNFRNRTDSPSEKYRLNNPDVLPKKNTKSLGEKKKRGRPKKEKGECLILNEETGEYDSVFL